MPVRGRPVTLSREAEVFRLAFTYRADLVARAKQLPFATFDPASKSWTARVCTQTVQQLRRMHHEGLLDVSPDELLYDGEELTAAREAVLRAGSGKRPYYVHMATRDSNLFPALRAIPGALWEKKAGALSYPAAAAPALADLVDRGTLDDPDDLLRTSAVTVAFDGRIGRFAVRGNAQAAAAFDSAFPAVDVVATWKTRGLEVEFLDAHTEAMYRGELARVGEGIQPEGMRLDLMTHQRQSVAIAVERDGFAVWDEPGVGKTSSGIGVGMELLNRGQIERVVAVVPAAVRTQWANEIKKFTKYTDTDIVIVRGDRKQRAAAYEAAEHATWVIVHYDVLARDEDDLKPIFAGALVIADEAHRVKNHSASRSKALKSLSRGAARRLSLTGTPVETSPNEWYEVLSGFTIPGCLGSPFEFNERYRFKAKFGGYEGARNLGELRERSKPFYVRRSLAQVAPHLPPLRVATTTLDPSPAYAGMLRRAHAEAVEEIRDASMNNKMRSGGETEAEQFSLVDAALFEEASDGAAMTAVGQLRLLCSSPRLIHEDSAAGKALVEAGLVPDEDGPKMDEIRTICAELLASQQRRKQHMADEGIVEATRADVTGERVVLFTFSKRMAALIATRLSEDGVPFVSFTGDTSSDERDAAVAAFTDPNSDVIAFVATDAAAEGLNLGACCSQLINIDLPWTPSRLIQRSQRIHRLDGQAAHYQVTNLIIAGTMEAGVLKLLEARSDMADTLFGSEGSKRRVIGARSKTSRVSFGAEALAAYAEEHPPTPTKPTATTAAASTAEATNTEGTAGRDVAPGVPAPRTVKARKPQSPDAAAPAKRDRAADRAPDGGDYTSADHTTQLRLL